MNTSIHSFGAWVKRFPWMRFCRRCGLIALRNKLTEKAIREPCKGPEIEP